MVKSFKLWLESKFIKIPDDVVEQIVKLAEGDINSALEIYKMATFSPKTLFVGTIVFNENIINIILTKQNVAYFDKDDSSIYIPFSSKSIQHILNFSFHELGHVADPKIQKDKGISDYYKKIAQKLNRTDAEQSSYVKEPVEFDAIGSNIDTIIKREFEKLKSIDEKERLIINLENWLKYNGEFPYKNNNFDFFDIWKTNKTLWKKLKQRVFNLTLELKAKLKVELKKLEKDKNVF